MSNSKPKYIATRDAVYREAAGNPAGQLPSERDICRRYGVSRITAKKALDSLAVEGLVRRQVGRGTFLTGDRGRRRINLLLVRGPGEFAEFFRNEAELFSQARPGVSIDISVMSSKQVIAHQFGLGEAGIIITPNTGYLAELGLLCPLEQMPDFPQTVSALHGNWTQWYDDHAHPGQRHCYSLPYMISPDVFAYNGEYAQMLGLSPYGPGSWEDILEWGRAGATLAREGFQSTTLTRSNSLPISYLLNANRGEVYLREKDGRTVFDFSGGLAWLEFFRKLVEIAVPAAFQGSRLSLLVQGKSLFEHTAAAWVLHQSRQHGMDGNIRVCPIPPHKAGQPSFSNVSKWEMALFKNPRHEESRLAWEFIRWCVSSEGAQRRLTEVFSCLAVNREVFARQQSDPQWFPFCQALAGGRLRCDHPLQHMLGAQMRSAFYRAVTGETSCKQADEQIQGFARSLLESATNEPDNLFTFR